MKTTVSVPPHETQSLASSSSTSPPTGITTLDPDIIRTHILPRLDGATLTALSCVSSELRHLCIFDEDLWRNICTASWPSLLDPIASHVISTFPGGHRSFFSDAFPSLYHDNHSHRACPPPTEFIYAVDIYRQGQVEPLLSRVQNQRIDIHNYWFCSNRFAVGFFVPNVLVPIPGENGEWLEYLRQNLRLSCILIDPTRKRAANLSGCKPVSVRQHSKLGDLAVVYAVLMAGEHRVSTEMVQCLVKVICRWSYGRGLSVCRVVMEMEDMDGWPVMGNQAVMILQSAIQNGERKKFDQVRAGDRFQRIQIAAAREKAARSRRIVKFPPKKKIRIEKIQRGSKKIID